MKISADKRLFWFLKDGVKLDISKPSQLDLYIQQVLTCGSTDDVRRLFRNVDFPHFKSAFARLKQFLPWEVKKFWEDAIGSH